RTDQVIPQPPAAPQPFPFGPDGTAVDDVPGVHVEDDEARRFEAQVQAGNRSHAVHPCLVHIGSVCPGGIPRRPASAREKIALMACVWGLSHSFSISSLVQPSSSNGV